MISARAVWSALLLALSLALAGCSETPEPTGDDLAVYDFARDLAVAEVAFERSRLRVADPVFGERLGAGWGSLETDAAGASFRWTLGHRAEFDVFVARPRDVTLVCRCAAFSWPGAPAQQLAIEIGGFRSEAVPVQDGETMVPIPSEAWIPGWNRLVLVASRATAPSAVLPGNDDARELGLRVEALEFRGLEDAEAPSVEGELLRLPAGTSVTSFGESAGQDWTLGDVESDGAVQLGVYLGATAGRRALQPGPIAAPLGAEIAVQLVAEPADLPWWRRLLNGDGSAGEIRVRGARILLAADRLPRVEPGPTATERYSSAAGVIVYMIDTLRADRLGAYGSELGLTPCMDELAEESVVFTDARAQSSWTRPSVVSTFTGLYPQTHGVDERNDGLSGEVETLAERLWTAGVYTVGVITNGNVSHGFGLGQGFGEYKQLPEKHSRESVHVLSDELNQWGLYLLNQHGEERGDQPFFLYLHATDPHAPYTPQEPFATRFASGVDRSLGSLDSFRELREGKQSADEAVRDQLLALYDAEVAWTDHQLGVLIDELRERDLWDDTLFVVVADHGEEFLDHGHWEHGRTLFDEQLRVPLMIKPPAGVGTPRRVAGPAGHVDLAPTILDALGVDYDPAEFDGRTLWPALVGASDRSTGGRALSHLELADESLRSLVVGPWKLIEDLRRRHQLLFDVAQDVAELDDLSAEKGLRASVLGQERRRLEESLEPETAEELELDDETKKQLEALGYAG